MKLTNPLPASLLSGIFNCFTDVEPKVVFTPPGNDGGQSEALRRPLYRTSLGPILPPFLSSLFSPTDNVELRWLRRPSKGPRALRWPPTAPPPPQTPSLPSSLFFFLSFPLFLSFPPQSIPSFVGSRRSGPVWNRATSRPEQPPVPVFKILIQSVLHKTRKH